MMLKFLPMTALALGLSGGVALADRGGDHRGTSEHRSAPQHNVVVRDHHETRGGGRDAVVVRDHRGWDRGGRVVVRNEPRYHNNYNYNRRPIYVSRPVIRQRYYSYYRRPALIVESYGAMPGYYWVRGQWTWDGNEWIWQPGHYQPDEGYYGAGFQVDASY
jgi:hypothetical protein